MILRRIWPWMIVNAGWKRGLRFCFSAISCTILARIFPAIAVPSIFWAVIASRVEEKLQACDIFAIASEKPERKGEAFVVVMGEEPQANLGSSDCKRHLLRRPLRRRTGREAKVTGVGVGISHSAVFVIPALLIWIKHPLTQDASELIDNRNETKVCALPGTVHKGSWYICVEIYEVDMCLMQGRSTTSETPQLLVSWTRRLVRDGNMRLYMLPILAWHFFGY